MLRFTQHVLNLTQEHVNLLSTRRVSTLTSLCKGHLREA